MSEVAVTTPAVVVPAAASEAAPTTLAVAAPPSETVSKADAAPASTKANKPATKEPGPTAASLLAPKRYIPGAPPPEPPKAKAPKQKNKKKEKKEEAPVLDIPDAHSAALIESAPAQSDIDSGKVAEELIAGEDEIDAMLKEDEEKEEEKKGPSPAVLAVEKKVKNLQERISRAKKYSETPEKELNEDQKILKANLPTLEATLKEMQEVITAIQNFETKHEAIHQAEKKKRKQDELARQRQAIRELLNAHESKTIVKVHTVLSFISLSSSLTNPSSSRPFVSAMDELDRAAIAKAASVLLSEEVADKTHVINGLVNEKSVGEVEGVHFKRLRELAVSFARPLSPEPTGIAPAQTNGASTANLAASGMTFTTDSELEQPRALQFGALDEVSGLGTNQIRENGVSTQILSMENSIEIVEGNSIPSAHTVQQEWVEVEKDEGHAEKGQAEATFETGAIDWAADDEGELPSIDSLNAKFGTSGDATPIDTPGVSSTPTMQGLPPNAWTSTPDTDETTAAAIAALESNAPPAIPRAPEDDGWTSAHSPRGASGHRGHRGGFHHRGSGGGTFEGFRGDRGGSGFRGRGRGGGEFRGGPRGGDGEFRGHRGGDGEFRGGRGGGDSEFRGGHRGGSFGSGWQRPAGNGAAEGSAEGEEGTRPEGGRGGRGGGHGFERGRGRGDWRGDGERRGRGFRARPGPGPPPPASVSPAPSPAPAP
ncbi:hypothetical protein FRB98_007973 [Tulasnella sp. 332]|nr:hypothetical protein FRB98_007973 [Tulasnella sp. 332]